METLKPSEIERLAVARGLSLHKWAPGDGSTRYRFSPAGVSGYDAHDGYATLHGRREATIWIRGYDAALRPLFAHRRIVPGRP